MIIVRTSGGLGNQMFQYALGRCLSIKNNTEIKIDNSMQMYTYNNKSSILNIVFRKYELNYFNIQAQIANQSEIPFYLRTFKLGKIAIFIDAIRRRTLFHKGREKDFSFDRKILDLKSDVYLDGDWQSYKYFEDIREVIRKDFKFNNQFNESILTLEKEIEQRQSVCVHVRRGDYVGNTFHDVVTKEYYTKGLDIINKKMHIDRVYVFSDDIQWCEKNLMFNFSTTFVSNKYAGESNTGHFELMKSCKHFVIANSSFSWWAAWLSNDINKIVIAPKKWFADESIDTKDLIPEQWTQI